MKLINTILFFSFLGLIIVGCNNSTDFVEQKQEINNSSDNLHYVRNTTSRLDSIYAYLAEKKGRQLSGEEKEVIHTVENVINELNMVSANIKQKKNNYRVSYKFLTSRNELYLYVNSVSDLVRNIKHYLPVLVKTTKSKISTVTAAAPGGAQGEGTLMALEVFQNSWGTIGDCYLSTSYWYKNGRQTGIVPRKGTHSFSWPYQCHLSDSYISDAGAQVISHAVFYEVVLNYGLGDLGFEFGSLQGTISDYFSIPSGN